MLIFYTIKCHIVEDNAILLSLESLAPFFTRVGGGGKINGKVYFVKYLKISKSFDLGQTFQSLKLVLLIL